MKEPRHRVSDDAGMPVWMTGIDSDPVTAVTTLREPGAVYCEKLAGSMIFCR